MRQIALFSGEIYTAGTNFTQPPVVTVATNLNSECCLVLSLHCDFSLSLKKQYKFLQTLSWVNHYRSSL